MDSTVNVKEAQAQFPKLLREVRRRGAVTVHRRGKIAAFVISPARMEAMIETVEILANPRAMKNDQTVRSRSARNKRLCLSR